VSDAPVDVVRRLFEHLDSGRLAEAIELLSEDFVTVVPPSMSAEPDSYHGHEGVRRYFAAFEGQLDDVRFEALDMIEAGDRVLVPLRLRGRGVTSGIEVEQSAVAVHQVRGGKVTRIDPHPDLESAYASLPPAAGG
jgi:ketosteroid isomerase-like protein